jgi:hypothetical protein
LRSIVWSDVPTLTTTNGRARAVCASTSPRTEPLIFHCTKSPNIPIAMTTTGTISGESTSPFTSERPGNRPRLSPSAARVPSTVASAAVRTATIRLLTIAVDH